MKTRFESLSFLLTLCLLTLLPLRGAEAVAIAESRLDFLWDTFTVTGGIEGEDYVWDDSRIYYGAHSESERYQGTSALESDIQSASVNPLNPSDADSVLTTSGWSPTTHGAAYLTQDDGEGNELSRASGRAYSDNASGSFANGNAHWGRNLIVYNEVPLTFSIDYLFEQTLQRESLALEEASAFSRPDIYIRDDYNNGATVVETFEAFYNELTDAVYYQTFSYRGTLSFTTVLALENTGFSDYAGSGIYWFEGHAHSSANARSEYAPPIGVPEPSGLLIMASTLVLLFTVHKASNRHRR